MTALSAYQHLCTNLMLLNNLRMPYETLFAVFLTLKMELYAMEHLVFLKLMCFWVSYCNRFFSKVKWKNICFVSCFIKLQQVAVDATQEMDFRSMQI